jgi:hypothetical protein
MKFRMDATLKFWVEVELERSKRNNPDVDKNTLLISILLEFEAAGHSMRTLGPDGLLLWKATPKLLEELAEAELDDED